MYFKQFYLGCLAHASYMIGSNGEAAIVDPQRDVDQYLDEAKRNGFSIKYVLETHLHADFVSGHRELAERTGAEIIIGERANAAFPHRPGREGEVLRVGNASIRILETPGHTPEGISFLVADEADPSQPGKLLTGDTLFIGDVGRPDLAAGKGFTPEAMAAMLYDSLHEKILPLGDDIEIFPAHGAGSLCGRNISKETSSTIGMQRKNNYALQPMPKEEFVRLMTADLVEQPRYFSHDAEMNRLGASSLQPATPVAAVNPDELLRLKNEGVAVVDVRTPADFGAGHIPGSINIGLGGQYASWAGTLVPLDARIVLVTTTDDQAAEARMRLARVGLENVVGYLQGGIVAWRAQGLEISSVDQIPVQQLHEELTSNPALQFIDVRRPGEYRDGHAVRAAHAPLDQLEILLKNFDPARRTAVICAGGYRSSIGTSILEQHGFREVVNVTGGTAAWKEAGLPMESEKASS